MTSKKSPQEPVIARFIPYKKDVETNVGKLSVRDIHSRTFNREDTDFAPNSPFLCERRLIMHFNV